MSFEFNISCQGAHFFATHARSCTDRQDAYKLYAVLSEKFPKSEGFEISCTLDKGVRFGVDLDNFTWNE